jgi:hypothetical protein
MAEEMQFKAGINTHENVIFTCYGGASNTGITSGLAALEAVKVCSHVVGGFIVSPWTAALLSAAGRLWNRLDSNRLKVLCFPVI